MEIKLIEKKARELKKRLGGSIFIFPIEEDNPFSQYAFSTIVGKKQFTYPKPADISEAALYVQSMFEVMEQYGYKPDFEKNVRFVVYSPQMNAPDVTMRRLKKDPFSYRKA